MIARRRTRRALALAGLAAWAAHPFTASAQIYTYGQLLDSEIPLATTTGRNQAVTERVRPELTPIGLPLGGFRLFPTMTGGLGYTSNVIGAEVGKQSDGYAELNPQLVVKSQWQRHSLTGTVSYDGLRYFGTPAKNEDGFLAQVDGQLDIKDSDNIVASASYRRTYEDQEEASFPLGGGGAVGVNQPRALLRATYVANRLRWTLSTDYNGFRYLDTISTTDQVLDLSYRNRDVYRASGRAEYLIGKDNSIFGQFTYRRTDYLTSDSTEDRTSNEWRASVGAIADVTDLVRVAGAVGYFRRTYRSPLFRSVGGLAMDVRADYYVTPLTTLTAIVSRELEEASVRDSSGYINLRAGARIDHELLRNLIPFAFADYVGSNFRGIDRNDRALDGGVGVNYLVNRRFTCKVSTQYISRVSHGDRRGPDISEMRGLITLAFHP
jgi:hypothetical protein